MKTSLKKKTEETERRKREEREEEKDSPLSLIISEDNSYR